jgi:hypothetical protein
MKNLYTKYWSENLRGRAHSEGIGVNGRIILSGCLKSILRGFEVTDVHKFWDSIRAEKFS